MFSEAYLPEHRVPPPACPKDSRLLPPQNDPSGSGPPPKATIDLRNEKEAKPFKWTADLGRLSGLLSFRWHAPRN